MPNGRYKNRPALDRSNLVLGIDFAFSDIVRISKQSFSLFKREKQKCRTQTSMDEKINKSSIGLFYDLHVQMQVKCTLGHIFITFGV